MNRSRKLFIAAALVAAGYGVASLLGPPRAPYLPAGPPSTATLGAGRPAQSVVGGPPNGFHERGSVRLLPDVLANSSPDQLSPMTSTAPFNFETKSHLPLAASDTAGSVSEMPPQVAATLGNASIPMKSPAAATDPSLAAPRATFRDVSPRLFGYPQIADASPIQPAERAGSPSVAVATHDAGDKSRSTGPNSAIMQSSYVSTGMPAITLAGPTVAPSLPSTQLASVAPKTHQRESALPSAFPQSTLEPLRPPITGVNRLHTIVDGDSLPKLAKRYLHDPRRTEEIFALNKDVLNSPDLLPIGVELKIPAPKASGRGG